MLKANQMYLDFYDEPYNVPENTFGKPIDKIYLGLENSEVRILWRKAIETGKPQYLKKYRYDKFERGLTYWDITLTPLKENGVIQYMVARLQEVTEKVLNRKKIQEQIEEIALKNRQIEAIFESIQDNISIFDRNGRYLRNSNEIKKLFEQTNIDVWTLENETDFFDLDDNPIPKEELCGTKLMKGEKIKNARMKLVRDGKEHYLEVNGTPIFDENNEFQMGVVLDVDITEIVNLSKQLKQQKELLEAVIENMNDAIVIYDKTRKVMYTNFEARKLYHHVKVGSKVEEIYNFIQSFDLENNPISFDSLPTNRSFKGEKIRNERSIRKLFSKTAIVEINAVPILDDKNNLALSVVSHRDISKTVEYEEKLSKQNELLTNIMNNIRESMIVFDKHGEVLFADKESKENIHNVITFIRNYYNSKKVYNFDGKEITYQEAFIFRIIKGEIIKDEITYYDSNGKRVYTMSWGKPIFDNKGDFLYGFYCVNNITEFISNQKMLGETQERLLKLEREKNESLERTLEMKDEFLSLISHEFRTPLNVINSAIQVLNLIYANDMKSKVKEYFRIIRQNTNRQLRLVNNILDITRANAGSIKINKKNIDVVFLTKAIVESVYVFADQKGVKITFNSSFSEKIVAIDDEKYERIILNLLSNAIKFTPSGKDVFVKLYSIEGNIYVDVKDNGIGIPPDKIDIIFDKFGQVDSLLSRQAEGSGIGLSLVKKFIEALGGSISVKSEMEKGSTFTIVFPNEMVMEEHNKELLDNSISNNLLQTINIDLEFSDIYL
jgi:PAS domain S-box-containing protein